MPRGARVDVALVLRLGRRALLTRPHTISPSQSTPNLWSTAPGGVRKLKMPSTVAELGFTKV